MDLLDTLPADHPSRATLEADISELVDILVQRQRRRFEPFTAAGVLFGVNVTLAAVMAGVACGITLQILGVWVPSSEPITTGDQWTGVGTYAALAIFCAGCAFWFGRRQQREHPKQSQPEFGGLAAAEPHQA